MGRWISKLPSASKSRDVILNRSEHAGEIRRTAGHVVKNERYTVNGEPLQQHGLPMLEGRSQGLDSDAASATA